jgi:GTPase SAR1 family protein
MLRLGSRLCSLDSPKMFFWIPTLPRSVTDSLDCSLADCLLGIDFNSRMIRVGGSICKLEIWDTAGQERFSTITANYYRGAQGALLVYDIGRALFVAIANASFSLGRRESFDRVRAWYDRAKQLGGQDIEPVLIGNKSDINRSLVEVARSDFTL